MPSSDGKMASDSNAYGLRRELTWIHSLSVIVGTMIGAGIFIVTAQAAEIMGPAVPIGFLAAVPVTVATALIYAVYLSSPLGNQPGGAYVHISRTWNSLFAGYVFMWLKCIAFIGAVATIGLGFGEAMHFFDAFTSVGSQWWAVAWIAVFFGLNLAGIDVFGRVQTAMTVGLLAVLTVIVVPGLAFVDPANFSPLFPDEQYDYGVLPTFIQGTAVIMFSYAGFEALAQTAGETRNPQKTLPPVFLYSTLFVGLLYTLVTVVVIGVLGWQSAAASATPLTATAQVYFPVGTAVVVVIGSMLAFATSLNASFMVPSRILFAFAADRLIPSVFMHVNRRFGTPDIGLTITFVVSTFIVVTGTFEFALRIALAAIFLLYAAHAFSALALPWIRPSLYEQCTLAFTPWILAVIAGCSAVSMAAFTWLTLEIDSVTPAIALIVAGDVVGGVTRSPALLVLAWLLVGVLIYVGYSTYRKTTGGTNDSNSSL